MGRKKSNARRQTAAQRVPLTIAREICQEIRGVVRLDEDLYTPLKSFTPFIDKGVLRYYVDFDNRDHLAFTGPKFGGLLSWHMPDERILDRVAEFAKAVWHLKDRLHQYAVATKQSAVDVDAHAKACPNLLIAADLANFKKHGRNDNRSNLNPRLDLVKFDTSKSGAVELFDDTATQHKELIVSKTSPIAFTADILGDGDVVLGDARQTIASAFADWFPIIQRLGVLSGDNNERVAVRSILVSRYGAKTEDFQQSNTVAPSSGTDADVSPAAPISAT